MVIVTIRSLVRRAIRTNAFGFDFLLQTPEFRIQPFLCSMRLDSFLAILIVFPMIR